MISRNLKIIFISGLLIYIMLTIPVQADEVDIFTYDGEEETASEEAYELRMDYYEELEEKFSMRQQIVDYALSFVGITPYVAGGSSLYYGTDCSGFVNLIFADFGIWLSPASDAYQDSIGVHVAWEDRLPGDIIVYDYGAHVGIYIGNDYIVHCSSPESGTVCWPWDYRNITAVVRVLE